MTYNVWFDQYNWENRLKAVAKIIEDKDSDIICLQEVTDSFINFCFKTSLFKKIMFSILFQIILKEGKPVMVRLPSENKKA